MLVCLCPFGACLPILFSNTDYFAILLKAFICIDYILCLSCSVIAQTSHPYKELTNASVLHTLSLVSFWTSEFVKFLLIIPVTWINFDILKVVCSYSGIQ